jgi:hypothetical protein
MMLKIEFDEQVWSAIIDMLAEHPYKRSGAIINTMAQKIQEQRPDSGLGTGNGKISDAPRSQTDNR